MTDFVDIGGQSVPVVAWKYVVDTGDDAGLTEYATIQYGYADRATIERQAREAGFEVVAFEPLVSASDVEAVIDA